MRRSINATGHDALRQREFSECKRLSVLRACRDCDYFRVVVAVVVVTHAIRYRGLWYVWL